MEVLQSRVLLRPADLDAALDFYEDRLGLSRYRDWGEDGTGGVVFFLGGGYLELTEGDDDTPAPAGVRLWLQVADVTATCDELASRGVTIDEEPAEQPWGLVEATIHDPDGLEIVLVEIPVSHPLRRRQPGT